MEEDREEKEEEDENEEEEENDCVVLEFPYGSLVVFA